MLSTIQKLLLAFITLIIGLVLIGSIAVSTDGMTSYASTTGESHTLNTNGTALNTSEMEASVYTVTNNPTSWQAETCPLTAFSLSNTSGTVLTVDTDYRVYLANGTFTLLNTADTVAALYPTNVSNVAYQYCGDDYMQGWGGTILDLIPGFFALAILIFSVGMFYSIAKDTGII